MKLQCIFLSILLLTAMGCSDSENESSPLGTVESTTPETLLIAGTLPAENYLDASSRPQQELNGSWYLTFDDNDVGISERWYAESTAIESWQPVKVPGAWDYEHPDGFEKVGIGWYGLRFTPTIGSDIIRLRFDGVHRDCRAWLNGVELGYFDLPYLPFQFDVTNIIRPNEENTLILRITNDINRQTLPAEDVFNQQKHGWWPYGGLIRPVYLEGSFGIYVAQTRIQATPDGRFQAKVFLENPFNHIGMIVLEAAIYYNDKKVMDWEPVDVTVAPAAYLFTGSIMSAKPWSPETPEHLYKFVLKTQSIGVGEERVEYDFAFRRFEAREGKFYLNGQDCFLCGINRHEDHPVYGPVFNEEAMATDVQFLKNMNVDFMRTAHYPNDVRTVKALENAGIMLAEEIPVYKIDGEQMADPVVIDLTLRALEILIIRDYNRPGVVMWSLQNEVHSWEQSAVTFTQLEQDLAKELDPTRPTMLAAFMAPVLSEFDIASGVADVIGINIYAGWYMQTTADATDYMELMYEKYPSRTFFLSEYGAGCVQGWHLDEEPGEEFSRSHSYTEEYQAWFHEQYLSQVDQLIYIRGTMPWIFADFRYQWTPFTGHPIDKFNLKGFLSYDRIPKQVYHVYADYYANK